MLTVQSIIITPPSANDWSHLTFMGWSTFSFAEWLTFTVDVAHPLIIQAQSARRPA